MFHVYQHCHTIQYFCNSLSWVCCIAADSVWLYDFVPLYSSYLWSLCRLRRCWLAPPESRPDEASQTRPATCSFCNIEKCWLLGIWLHKCTPDNNNKQPNPRKYWSKDTYLVGDTTSKQNLRSMSSQGLTEQSRKSSTTTVRASCNENR